MTTVLKIVGYTAFHENGTRICFKKCQLNILFFAQVNQYMLLILEIESLKQTQFLKSNTSLYSINLTYEYRIAPKIQITHIKTKKKEPPEEEKKSCRLEIKIQNPSGKNASSLELTS